MTAFHVRFRFRTQLQLFASMSALLASGCALSPAPVVEAGVGGGEASAAVARADAGRQERADGAAREAAVEPAATPQPDAAAPVEAPLDSPSQPGTAGTAEPGAAPETREPSSGIGEPRYRDFPTQTLYDLLLAEFAVRRGHYPEALDRYRVQARSSRDRQVAARSARLAEVLGSDAQAVAAAKLWADIAPDSARARQHAGLTLIRAGRREPALEHLGAAAQLDGQRRFAYLADYADEVDAPTRAALLEAVQTLLARYPEARSLHFAQAVLLEQADRPEKALQALEQAGDLAADEPGLLLRVRLLKRLERPEVAIAALEHALDAGREAPQLRYALARLLVEAGRLDAARAAFETLLARNDRNAEVLLSLALLALERKRVHVARTYLERLLDTGERTGAARFYLAELAAGAGDVDTALEHYRHVGPGYEFAAAQGHAGQLLLAHSSQQRLDRWFDTMRARYPEEARTLWRVQSEVLRRSGRDPAAETVLDRALAAGVEGGRLRYSRAMTRLAQGDLSGFEADLRQLLEADPDNVMALNALGYTLADRTERLEEALALVQRAHELAPRQAAIIDSLGWVRYQLGEYPRAVDLLRRAWRALADPEVAAHLGEALWANGNRGEARRIWSKALEQAPDHPALRETVERFVGGDAGELERVRVAP